MLLSGLPDFQQRTPHAVAARIATRIVWQERYEGIAVVAYQGGKAVAGISGPWSDRFALTWWQPNPDGQFETFDTLDAAKLAVEARCQPVETTSVPRAPRASLLQRLLAWLQPALVDADDVALLRQRAQRQHDDLSGLNFSATR